MHERTRAERVIMNSSVAKHYGCKRGSRWSLIANGRSQPNRDFSCARNMNCCSARCAANIIPTVWFSTCTVLSDGAWLLTEKVLDTESWNSAGCQIESVEHTGSAFPQFGRTHWIRQAKHGHDRWATSCKRPTELSCLFQSLYCIPTSSETNTK